MKMQQVAYGNSRLVLFDGNEQAPRWCARYERANVVYQAEALLFFEGGEWFLLVDVFPETGERVSHARRVPLGSQENVSAVAVRFCMYAEHTGEGVEGTA